MALTAADFKAQFSELVSQSDDAVTAAIAEGQVLHSATELGTFLAAAHLLTFNADGLPGEVTSLRVGEMASTSSATARNARQSFLSSTSYGRRLLAREVSSRTAVAYAA